MSGLARSFHYPISAELQNMFYRASVAKTENCYALCDSEYGEQGSNTMGGILRVHLFTLIQWRGSQHPISSYKFRPLRGTLPKFTSNKIIDFNSFTD